MRNVDSWYDDETWERVADGPLSPVQLAELVAACDAQPELWKRCALVLLEEQVLRHELQSLARDQLMPNVAGVAAPVAEPHPLPCPAPNQLLNASSPVAKQSGSIPRSALLNNLALVAAVMVVFGIGWQSSQRFGQPSRSMLPAELANGPVTNMAQSTSRAAVDPAVIDQVNAGTLATAMQVDWNENLDPEYQQLRRSGYDVEAQEGLMPVWLNDGSSAVVPYQQIKVRPKSKGRAY